MASTFSADWLMAQQFPELRYVVDGIIPEGLTVLAAAPKTGKSWLALGLAVATSSGGVALGCIPCQPTPVLYLALEDGQRRLQSRLQALGVTNPSPTLSFGVSVPHGEMLATISSYMEDHQGKNPLVILDTLGKAMPPAGTGETAYDRDYRVLGAIKRAADQNPGSGIIVVHHTRKADGADFVDAVSGTQGIAGAADTVLLLKRARMEQTCTLQVTSRDTTEGEYQLEMDGVGNWVLAGGSRAEAAQKITLARSTGGNIDDSMRKVITLVNQHPAGITPTEVAAALGIPRDKATTYLGRAHESQRLDKPKRGVYTPVRSVISLFPNPEANNK